MIALLIYQAFISLPITALVIIYPLALHSHGISIPWIGATFACYGAPLLLNCCFSQYLRSKLSHKAFISAHLLLLLCSMFFFALCVLIKHHASLTMLALFAMSMHG